MRWGSLDSFLVQDKFWQDKMGNPIANKDFMLALLTHGTLDSCRFYYLDEEELAEGRAGGFRASMLIYTMITVK